MLSFKRKLRFEQCEDRRMLAVFTVTNSNDGLVDSPDDQPGTLRQAIFDANFAPGADTINFALPTNQDTITLTNGELTITESVTIDALGQDITIDAGNGVDSIANTGDGSRIFSITLSDATDSVTLAGLTITKGDLPNPNGDPGKGGGIFVDSEGSFELIDSTITGNAAALGGGLFVMARTNSHTLIKNSTVENNLASSGGGVYVGHALYTNLATVEVIDSTIKDNQAGTAPNTFSSGGGIFISDVLYGHFPDLNEYVISGSTISGNTAYSSGGGISSSTYGDLQIINSTISGNRAVASGGGLNQLSQRGPIRISHSTIVDNEVGFDTSNLGNIPGANAAVGGGIAVEGGISLPDFAGFSPVVLDHVIIAGNRDLWNSDETDHTPGHTFHDEYAPDVHINAGTPVDPYVQQKIKADYSFLGLITGGNGNALGGVTTAVAVGTNNQDDGLPFPNLIGTVLGPLQDNGGPTETHAPLLGSPGD